MQLFPITITKNNKHSHSETDKTVVPCQRAHSERKQSQKDLMKALNFDKEQMEPFGPVQECERSKRYNVWIYLG